MISLTHYVTITLYALPHGVRLSQDLGLKHSQKMKITKLFI